MPRDKTKWEDYGRGCREGGGGEEEKVEEHSREFVCQGLLALESFLFRFIVTLCENFCYFPRSAFARVTPAPCRSSRCERSLKAEVAR